MQLQKENKVTITLEIDREFYEDLEAEATRWKIPISKMLTRIFYAYFMSLANTESGYKLEI
ncbi:hypothetical protein A2W67_02585 [Candidatus Nomurabacteria bacterium RIFCSPLOWO2_02_40_28]|uniref:Ribbon-helix-helix protein CopG domain-containing protein n=2 Tax=Candidatus Nomuraibacteriota TaxID=1752729 RepID=A0A837HTH1_9BACT|nr:MAG: hypothetical protein UT27_C0007G0024 [Candidatus Nomurabacteria bacterium GW2011_GWD2_39_12]KKR20369.1 MAG: hypothetical protein UT51_C0004G0028 [Candidatus Nomurabacteria bacterium GW2011_GWC2_39_41]KKR37086.1 MAG: hypothetical protein UT70_C0003G0028 [Candidatus Nomurabacteria bacterium GW2011_GWE2_40_10]KKR38303.1 MAG: hypothetical protein UT73_C0004G0048 [Candidatus Nomurabacteria bacterium GW2011_GWB1_40_11]KKR39811.1 MAG: hypothetical protein UT74_C0005G0028 [Parcubacteria group b